MAVSSTINPSTKFSDPKENIKQMHLREGMRIADFGSGSGHYTLAASEIVGDRGKIYAIDIQQGLLRKVKALDGNTPRNIEVIWGDVEIPGGTKLKDGSIEGVIMANILFQLEKRGSAIAEAHRILKGSGMVYAIDWADSFGGLGPQASDVVNEVKARELFERGGFSFERSFPAGAHHWGMVFKKM